MRTTVGGSADCSAPMASSAPCERPIFHLAVGQAEAGSHQEHPSSWSSTTTILTPLASYYRQAEPPCSPTPSSTTPSRPTSLGDAPEVFIRREDAERFIEEVHSDDPGMAAKLGIEERELRRACRLAREADRYRDDPPRAQPRMSTMDRDLCGTPGSTSTRSCRSRR